MRFFFAKTNTIACVSHAFPRGAQDNQFKSWIKVLFPWNSFSSLFISLAKILQKKKCYLIHAGLITKNSYTFPKYLVFFLNLVDIIN